MLRRILVVSGSTKGRGFFEKLVKEFGMFEIACASDSRQAREALQQNDHELCIVNPPIIGGNGLEFVEYTAKNFSCGLIVVLKGETDERVVARAEEAGAFVVKTPISKTYFYQAFRFACASHNRMRQIQAENSKLTRKIEDIGMVDRAKCVLIQVLGMTEPQAHRYIEKQAMDMRVSKRQVAEELLKTYE